MFVEQLTPLYLVVFVFAIIFSMPVMEKIKAKHLEIKKIADSDLSDTKKEQKINALERELLALKQQARKIRTENMKEFESILTVEQKAEFEKIKKEGRAKHKMKGHPGPKPGFRPTPYIPKDQAK